jgi:hypothetical protein
MAKRSGSAATNPCRQSVLASPRKHGQRRFATAAGYFFFMA